jgi:hypothetical protein
MRILVVDDHRDLVDALVARFALAGSLAGFEVRVALGRR